VSLEPLPRNDQEQEPTACSEAAVLSSQEIFKGQRKVLIEHGGEFYRLQITARNRLLLQKWFVVLDASNVDCGA